MSRSLAGVVFHSFNVISSAFLHQLYGFSQLDCLLAMSPNFLWCGQGLLRSSKPILPALAQIRRPLLLCLGISGLRIHGDSRHRDWRGWQTGVEGIFVPFHGRLAFVCLLWAATTREFSLLGGGQKTPPSKLVFFLLFSTEVCLFGGGKVPQLSKVPQLIYSW